MKRFRLSCTAGGVAAAMAGAVAVWPSSAWAQGAPVGGEATGAATPLGDTAGGEEADAAAGAAAGEGSEGWKDRARIELGPLGLSPVLLVAVQAMPYVGDDSFFQAGDIAEMEGFRLRRGRLGLAGDFMDKARFAVSTELSSTENGKLRIHDAWLGYTEFEFLRAYAGARAVPYSRSAIMRSGNAALIERPLAVRAMAPRHQVGVALDGELWDGKLGYTGGVYNGFQRSEYFYDGWVENYSPFGNRFDGLAYAARLRAAPLGRLDPTMADEHHSPFRFGVGASYFFSDGGARNVHSAGGDALLHAYGFHLLAEALWSLSDPEDQPTQPTPEVEQVTSFAAVGEAGYMILKDALGIAVRFEWIDPNTNTDDEGDNWLITGGASYQLLERLLRVQADYTHREELHGLPLANDSVTLQFQVQLSALSGSEYVLPRREPAEVPAAHPETEADRLMEDVPRGQAEARPAEEGEPDEEPAEEPADEEPAEEPPEGPPAKEEPAEEEPP